MDGEFTEEKSVVPQILTAQEVMAINMRTCLPTLSLFFLFFTVLVDKSISQSSVPALLKECSKLIHEIIKETSKNSTHQTTNLPPPPPDYLNDYSYIQDSDNYTDLMDNNMVSAIRSNLPLLLLRCAVPDVNFTYTLSPNNVLCPKENNCFSNRTNLTYDFHPKNEVPENFTAVFRDSFKWWSEAISTVVNLTFTNTRYDDAEIKIVFKIFDNKTVGDEVVGGSFIELASNDGDIVVGYMVLNGTKYWALPNNTIKLNRSMLEDGVIDLGVVAMHQIGHLLGLLHSSHNESVMYPYILPQNQRKVQLSNDDKQQIKQVYSTYASGVGTSSWGFIITLSPGFACMFLLYERDKNTWDSRWGGWWRSDEPGRAWLLKTRCREDDWRWLETAAVTTLDKNAALGRMLGKGPSGQQQNRKGEGGFVAVMIGECDVEKLRVGDNEQRHKGSGNERCHRGCSGKMVVVKLGFWIGKGEISKGVIGFASAAHCSCC
ncbi:Metalloendoproteinase 5-MMP [Arachis hypogaea]|nr:Metalloendoproteinase 5-MMP [Arachis hypogaea]